MKVVQRHWRMAVIPVIAVGFFAAGASWWGSGVVDAQDPEAIQLLEKQSEAFAAVAEKATPAVVFIQVERTMERQASLGLPEGFEEFFGEGFFRRFFGPNMPQSPDRPGPPREPFRQRGQGSGFIISADGYILTNNHVVGQADRVRVFLHDGREFEAEVVGTDPESDVALIKVDARNLPTLKLGDSDAVKVGQWVLAIGAPFGQSGTVTAGIVSATGRNRIGITEYEDFIQTDAAINPGNSGGPLVNLKGEVVGMNTAIFSRTGGYMGIGFAIPVNMAKWIRDQILDQGAVTRGYLGVWMQPLDDDLRVSFGVPADMGGVAVTTVEPGSPAEEAGMEAGDVIVEFAGQPVEDSIMFRQRVAMMEPGRKFDAKVYRDGERLNLTITLGERPGRETVARREAPETGRTVGISVQNLTRDIAQQLGFENEQGVLVTQVRPGSAAADQGIRRGHLIQEVNREPVTNVREFDAALEKAPADKPVLLLVNDGRGMRFVALRFER